MKKQMIFGALTLVLLACSDSEHAGGSITDVNTLASDDSSSSVEEASSSSVVKESSSSVASEELPNEKMEDDRLAILEKSFDVFKGLSGTAIDNSVCLDEFDNCGSIAKPDSEYVYILNNIITPYLNWGDGRNSYQYKSKDNLRSCSVKSDSSGSAVYSIRAYQTDPTYKNGFRYRHNESTTSARYTVDGVDTIIIKSVGTESFENGFWGLDYSCDEFLQNFKDDCGKEDGLFKDFADGCSSGRPIVSCAFFLPEGKTAHSYIDEYEQELVDFCKADSVMYSAIDDPAHTPSSCMSRYDGTTIVEKCYYANGDEMDLEEWRKENETKN